MQGEFLIRDSLARLARVGVLLQHAFLFQIVTQQSAHVGVLLQRATPHFIERLIKHLPNFNLVLHNLSCLSLRFV
jgi:hypothetical protein